jgi:hypothetical protein
VVGGQSCCVLRIFSKESIASMMEMKALTDFKGKGKEEGGRRKPVFWPT